jgi:integrase
VPGLGPLAVADVIAPRIRRWRKNHVHDLRHTGNTLVGEAGASLRELMDRVGPSSTHAALIYQHRTSLRDKDHC